MLCDYEFFYEYRRKLSFFNDFEKNKGIKKNNSFLGCYQVTVLELYGLTWTHV